MKAKLLLLFFSCLIGAALIEGSLRLFARRLDLDMPLAAKSPFIYNTDVGYELKPHAVLSHRDEDGWRFDEMMNAEGFRGPERSLVKPAGTFRILVLGDSVVEAMTVRSAYMWEEVLEQHLNARATTTRRYEVINSGIGGYVSWQAAQRLRRHGLKYHPDLVLVMVGWNDFVYSTLPIWKPRLELSQIEVAYASFEQDHPKQDRWSRFKRGLSRRVVLIRLISHLRNDWRTRPQEKRLIARHQHDSGLPFNALALRLYSENLEDIYRVTQAAGTRMVLLTWPTVLAPNLVDDPLIQRRIVPTYVHFPLSTRELWMWYSRYQDAQREFARRHPDVVLIDAAQNWSASTPSERLRDFVDLAHLSIAGNARLADTVAPTVEHL